MNMKKNIYIYQRFTHSLYFVVVIAFIYSFLI